jgi:energy-coupling factor transport system substrate-specific component
MQQTTNNHLAKIATVDLVIIALLAGLDIGTKQVIRPIISVITEPLNIPGGAVCGGIFMMWQVVAIGITRKPGAATLTALIEAIISLIMPFGNFGILSFIIYLGPGLATDAICLLMRNKADNLPTCILATSAANATGTFLVATTALALPVFPLMFTTILATLTGGVGGVLANVLLIEIRKVGIGTNKSVATPTIPLEQSTTKKASGLSTVFLKTKGNSTSWRG